MPNSTAAGKMTAALPLALGDDVAVLDADTPGVCAAEGVSVTAGVLAAELDAAIVEERVRTGVRVGDDVGVDVVAAVPVLVAELVPVALLEGVPVDDDEPVSVALDESVLMALDEPVFV